jgi:hypothetical protein
VIDAVQDRLAAAKVIRNVLDVGRAEDSGREIETRDFYADAVTAPEQVGGGKNLDIVFADSPGTSQTENTFYIKLLSATLP